MAVRDVGLGTGASRNEERWQKTILEMKAGGHDTQGQRDSAADGLDKTGAGGAEKTGS